MTGINDQRITDVLNSIFAVFLNDGTKIPRIVEVNFYRDRLTFSIFPVNGDMGLASWDSVTKLFALGRGKC